MKNDLSSLVASANSILVVLPDEPAFDEVAAGLSFYLSLKAVKDTNIFCSAPMVVEFNKLIGVDKISDQVGNKNLTIAFNQYPAENIERVSADVEGTEFKLTVIPKAGLAAPGKDQISLGFSGIAVDLVILTGGKDSSQFSVLKNRDLAGAKLVHVGTKTLELAPERTVFSFAQPASSVSEVAAALLKGSGFLLDADIATNLIAGIEEASNHFTKEGVTAETFDTFAQLLRIGGQRVFKTEAIPVAPAPNVSGSVAGEAPKDWFEPKIYKGAGL